MSLAADSGTPVAAGTTEIAVTVTVTFRTAGPAASVSRPAAGLRRSVPLPRSVR